MKMGRFQVAPGKIATLDEQVFNSLENGEMPLSNG